MKFTRKLAVAAAVATAFAVSASTAVAAIAVSTAPGTAAPPPTLGSYQMTPFGDVDMRADGFVTDVPLPPITIGHPVSRPTGSILFNQPLFHTTIGAGWASWSHGYTGDVYHTAFSVDPNSATISMPPKVGAFYLYAEPNAFADFLVTATGRDGNGHSVTTTILINGAGGARYIGFYNTTFGAVTSITVSAPPAAGGFAVGEFGVGNQKLVKIT
jgi:hypothetical protein